MKFLFSKVIILALLLCLIDSRITFAEYKQGLSNYGKITNGAEIHSTLTKIRNDYSKATQPSLLITKEMPKGGLGHSHLDQALSINGMNKIMDEKHTDAFIKKMRDMETAADDNIETIHMPIIRKIRTLIDENTLDIQDFYDYSTAEKREKDPIAIINNLEKN